MKAERSGSWRLETSCVHAGEGTDPETRAIRRPIQMANSYELPTDVERLLEVFSWDNLDKFHYTREHSATPRHLEERPKAFRGHEFTGVRWNVEQRRFLDGQDERPITIRSRFPRRSEASGGSPNRCYFGAFP